jgi:flagellar protein FlaG
MDFDSLKTAKVAEYNKVYSNDNNGKSENKAENLAKIDAKKNKVDIEQVVNKDDTKGAVNTEQETNKYSDEDLYKGENFQNKMDKAIEVVNDMLEVVNKSFSYSIHEETKEVMISITDSKTGEVIKEIPSEESLDMIAKMRELAGIVIDEKR